MIELIVQAEEGFYTSEELAEFAPEEFLVRCRDCVAGVGRRESVYCTALRMVRDSDWYCKDGSRRG